MRASPRALRAVSFVLTTACNLRCSYCYQSQKGARRMDWATLRAGLDLLLASDVTDVTVGFLGGEPLLELPLLERAVDYVRAHAPPEKRVGYALSTNGLLLDERAARFLAEAGIATQLSFDGVPAAQAFRGAHTFGPLDALVRWLRRRHPDFFETSFKVAIVIHGGNLAYLADSVDYFFDLAVPTIVTDMSFTHDPEWRTDGMALLEAQFARIFARSLHLYHETGEIPFEAFRTTGRRPGARPQTTAMCGAGGGEALTIDVDGQASGCVTFVESYQRLPSELLRARLASMRLGDPRDRAFRRRLALYPEVARAAEIFDDKAEKWSAYGRCGDCRHLASCSVCPTAIGHIPGNTDPTRVPDNLCAYAQVSLDYRDRFPPRPTTVERLTGRGHVPRLLRQLRARVSSGDVKEDTP